MEIEKLILKYIWKQEKQYKEETKAYFIGR